MNADGQIYFAPEDEIPEADRQRYSHAFDDLLRDEMAAAKLGMRALIDEASGHQEERARDDLLKYAESLAD